MIRNHLKSFLTLGWYVTEHLWLCYDLNQTVEDHKPLLFFLKDSYRHNDSSAAPDLQIDRMCISLKSKKKEKRRKMAFVCTKHQSGKNKNMQKYLPGVSKADNVFIWSHLAVQRTH